MEPHFKEYKNIKRTNEDRCTNILQYKIITKTVVSVSVVMYDNQMSECSCRTIRPPVNLDWAK